MNNRPLYENLDTSFINLSALVRYLRHREFIGRIKVELNNYHAEIVLLKGNKLSVREHDKISGRTAHGEEAFQRILIRARESGGTIHVYQEVKETVKATEVKEIPREAVKVIEVPKTINGNSAPIPKPVEAINPVPAATKNGHETVAKVPPIAEIPKKPEPNGLKLPFDLSNKIEKKSKNVPLSAQDWQTLLGLTGELLSLIDKSLAEAKLDFKVAFSKACSEISADYPFLHPSANNFLYRDGKVKMSEQVNDKLFVSSVMESLRKILDKLGTNPKFATVYRNTTHKILALLNQRQTYYDKFSITPQLKKILGV